MTGSCSVRTGCQRTPGFLVRTMLASFQGLLCQGQMRIWCCGDDYDVDCCVVEEVVGGAVGLDAGVVFLGVIVGFGTMFWTSVVGRTERRARGGSIGSTVPPLHDGVELEVRDKINEGDVEDFGGEAVAYDADVVFF